MPIELLIVVFLIILITSLILPVIYKNKEKTDKGHVFSYYKLTYRRKMIRTLWLIPLIVILLIAISVIAELNTFEILLISLFFFVITFLQFFYNYTKWKKYEK
ncbi:hypothetical protein D3H55_16335 [Bacillus salacetis]|uniref:Uncharacterized protein n=1 Tax=Bacillus salacetis TaxID=2315464 RepID=A0A3A1QXN4_9BACI|nr:hypothetical protein D3H55_16335 [Bacillus salacetis]